VSVFSLHGFVKNLDKKFGRIALNKDYSHYFRAILCLFCPDFPQNPCSTDLFRLNDYLYFSVDELLKNVIKEWEFISQP
jgi:hypothetical protein